MSAVNLANQEWTKNNFDDFVVPKYISAPITQISNRAQLLDTSNMLQALMGYERIPFRGINQLPKEFGPLGEAVWELENRDTRIRFVGQFIFVGDGYGGYVGPSASSTTDFIEFTFYGTGINTLWTFNAGTFSYGITIDGGSEVTGSTVGANVLNNRGYKVNNQLVMANGLSLGWHTVKLRNTAGGLNFLNGVEFLNDRANIAIAPGQAFVGNKKEYLSALVASTYNAGFSGTKGGRVSKYLLNGAISQVVRECPASPSYLSSTDHTNEDQVKRIPFWEFGANRSDDFSATAAGVTSRAFTLDDGTTGLVALNATLQFTDQLTVQAGTSNFFAITFVGTGLDVVSKSDAGITRTVNFFVDGVSVGSIVTSTLQPNVVRKICSGLPYGTHTIKFVNGSGVDVTWGVSDFIIYQPKKPVLPTGAVEVADYNVMADYVASTSASPYFVAQGVLRKALSQREGFLTGTWTAPGLDPANFETGFNISSSATNSTVSYRFFGTGFEWRGFATTTTATNQTISVDGSSNLSGFTTAFAQVSSGISFTASTGVISGTSAANGKIKVQVSGLTLGYHTVTVTSNNANSNYVEVIDIITPVHINHPTLRIGSLGLLDNAKIGAIKSSSNTLPDLGKAKALLVFDITNTKILMANNISQVLVTTTGRVYVYFSKSFKTTNYVINYGGFSRNLNVAELKGHYFMIENLSQAFAYEASTYFAISCFGELADE